MTIKRIHVNQHVIKRNNKIDITHKDAAKGMEPPLTCKNSQVNHYGYEIIINEHTKIIYRPEKPLSCGAKVWIETTEPVTILTKRDGLVKME